MMARSKYNSVPDYYADLMFNVIVTSRGPAGLPLTASPCFFTISNHFHDNICITQCTQAKLSIYRSPCVKELQ